MRGRRSFDPPRVRVVAQAAAGTKAQKGPTRPEEIKGSGTVFLVQPEGLLGARMAVTLLGAGFKVKGGCTDPERAQRAYNVARKFGLIESSVSKNFEAAVLDPVDPEDVAAEVPRNATVIVVAGDDVGGRRSDISFRYADQIVAGAAQAGARAVILVAPIDGPVRSPGTRSLLAGALSSGGARGAKARFEALCAQYDIPFSVIGHGVLDRVEDEYLFESDICIAPPGSYDARTAVARSQVARAVAAALAFGGTPVPSMEVVAVGVEPGKKEELLADQIAVVQAAARAAEMAAEDEDTDEIEPAPEGTVPVAGTLSMRRAARVLPGQQAAAQDAGDEEDSAAPAQKKKGTGFFGFGSQKTAPVVEEEEEEAEAEEEEAEAESAAPAPKARGSGFFRFGSQKTAPVVEEQEEEAEAEEAGEEAAPAAKKRDTGLFGRDFVIGKGVARKATPASGGEADVAEDTPPEAAEEAEEGAKPRGTGLFGFGRAAPRAPAAKKEPEPESAGGESEEATGGSEIEAEPVRTKARRNRSGMTRAELVAQYQQREAEASKNKLF
ncbi:unnamed protein product [Pedinophyceae sp. YPF-701]|nr:unnamed protein product [Pedinophyceae sp. YPF-701]